MSASVQVLLATYNGEAYVDRQLESILVQSFGDLEVLVSDDGSQDETLQVVQRYAAADPRVSLTCDVAGHGGARDNFLWLVSQATAPYIAFSDQDDVWLTEKLALEMAEMRRLEDEYGTDTPLLVFSDLAVADEELEVVHPSFMHYAGLDPKRLSLANLLAQNVSPGCVMLADRALYAEALELPEDRRSVAMHDWWFMLTAAALGHIGYVDQPTMLYRQHGDNEVGAESNTAAGILGRLGTFADHLVPSASQLDGVDLRIAQARAFVETYADALAPQQRELCEGFAGLLGLAPLERVRWCHEHDVQNATPLMRLGMDWELALYEQGRKNATEGVPVERVETTSRPIDDTPIAVVMSTYNGERYLAEQIDSILAQDAPGVRLFVRDDGSSDGTLDLLKSYAEKGLLEYEAGENKGVVGSFFAALAMPPASYPFVAFCDQDDVWHPDKLSRALAVLHDRDQSIPQLYCSEYIFCNEQLEPTSPSNLNRIGVRFSTLMAESVCSGNTCVMNRALVDELLDNGTEGVFTHDWWCALVAAGLGEISFDEFASLDYRRIESSVSPTGSGGLELLKFRVRTFLGKGQLAQITAQLRHFQQRYGDRLDPEKRALLNRMLDGSRLSKAMTPYRLRQKPSEELAVRILYLAGLL